MTNPPPIVGKNADEPLTARASMEAKIKPTTASNAERFERNLLSANLNMMRVATKIMKPRKLICSKVRSFGSALSPRAEFTCNQISFITGKGVWLSGKNREKRTTHAQFSKLAGINSVEQLSLIHISEPTRLLSISYA